jgi:endonuclease/exonuclease/phosphatase family metal-dependent hydrolase
MRSAPTARRRTAAWALTLSLVGSLMIAAIPARASGGVTGVSLVDVSPSSFKVSYDSLGSGWHYTLWANTDRSKLLGSTLKGYNASSSSTSVEVTGLPYTTDPYWYRVEATRSGGRKTSVVLSTGLVPPAPTAVTLSNPLGRGTYLTWDSAPVTGTTIRQATDPSFTTGLRTYTIRGRSEQFTPYGLTKGTTYYFQVRSLNNGAASDWSSVVSGVARSSSLSVRVLTYNVLRKSMDGTTRNGETIAPWSKRRLKAASLIKSVTPDVIAVQEAGTLMGGPGSARQVDNLAKALDGVFRVARTEIPPSEPKSTHLGDYVLYRKATYRAVGDGWHWDLGHNHYAAYQLLEHRATNTRFLFVSPHLSSQVGTDWDQIREEQTVRMLTKAKRFAAGHGNVPIMYAGDFNSVESTRHPFDGPGIAMRAANAMDAFEVAATRRKTQYNSANHYLRRPPAAGMSIDRVFASPGVAMTQWKQLLKLDNGAFVGAIPSDHNPVFVLVVVPH